MPLERKGMEINQSKTSPQKQATDQGKETFLQSQAQDFTLISIHEKKISLTNFLENKILLIHFWATWCPYCLYEIPSLKKIDNTFADQVKILAIDILEKPEKVKKFVEQKGIKYDVLLDQDGEVARRYSIKGTPTSIVIDKKGNIAYFGYELPKAEQVIKSLIEINKIRVNRNWCGKIRLYFAFFAYYYKWLSQNLVDTIFYSYTDI